MQFWGVEMMKKKILSVAIISLFCSATAVAAGDEAAVRLEDVVVSGGFVPFEAQRYGRAATVLTRAEIEQRGIARVQDALQALPGVSVSGAGDSYTQVRIRGAEASHTLVLIDGIKAAGGDGEYILTGLGTADIERIEVLRGPQSVFYGSNASAGVINIITRKGAAGTEYGGMLEAGGDGYRGSAHLSSRSQRGGVALNFSHANDDGYDYSGKGGEKDGMQRVTAHIAADYWLMPALKLGMTYRKSEEKYDYDSTSWQATDAAAYVVDDPAPFSKRDEQLLQVYTEFSMLDGSLRHRLAYDRTDFDQSYDGGQPTDTEAASIKYLLSYGIDGLPVSKSAQLVNVMLEREENSSSTDARYVRESNSYAIEYRGSFLNGLDLQLGSRFDDNDVFKDVVTWNASASYTFASSDIRLHASAGTGVVNPSYFELFSDSNFGSMTYRGNPGLRPEKNRGFDVGVEFPLPQERGVVDVTYFKETLRDEIESYAAGKDSATGNSLFSYRNQSGNSDRQGLELSARLKATQALDVRLAYTYLHARNPDGSVEVRRPRHSVLLGATHALFGGRGSVSGDLRYVADNYDTQYWGANKTAKLPHYTTLDVAFQYALTKNIQLNARATNLFDKKYADTWGYAKRGRTLWLGVSASF